MLRDLIRQKRSEGKSRRPDFSKIKMRVNEIKGTALQQPEVPDHCYRKCNFCGKAILNADVQNHLGCCPKCGGYFRMHAWRRIEMIADEGSFCELFEKMPFQNPLKFPGYEAKLLKTRELCGLDEAVVTGRCTVFEKPAMLCVCDSRFIMSSMGYNFGEKLTRAIETATAESLPLIIYCCSGGARMQEGIVSLMQMAKTSAALKKHHDAGLLYLSVLTNPTTGGVTASFAMLGDVILAEPDALIGFAGPRVIEQTIRQKLPEGFQKSEFLLKHGFVDRIAERKDQKALLHRLIVLHDRETVEAAKKRFAEISCAPADARCGKAAEGAEAASGKKAEALSAWERVQLSRSAGRPKASDYIERLFTNFTELHGDRVFGDDGAVIGGIAEFCGMPVTVIAEQKGKNVKDNLKRNFGMPSPEGYRKALRLMKEADAFGRPIICLVDTPGAYPGMESEERGQGEAIASCLYELSGVKVPVLSIVLSEGGSGGALALSVANEVWMLENAVYSILSPEGFASILYKDAKKAKEASGLMKLTAKDLLSLGIIEAVIPETEPASMESVDALSDVIGARIRSFLAARAGCSGEELCAERYRKFRNL